MEIPTLKDQNIVHLTEKRVKHIKVGELEELLSDIPEGYKSAIVRLLKTIFNFKVKTPADEIALRGHRESLSQMIEQTVWIKTQKQVTKNTK